MICHFVLLNDYVSASRDYFDCFFFIIMCYLRTPVFKKNDLCDDYYTIVHSHRWNCTEAFGFWNAKRNQ